MPRVLILVVSSVALSSACDSSKDPRPPARPPAEGSTLDDLGDDLDLDELDEPDETPTVADPAASVVASCMLTTAGICYDGVDAPGFLFRSATACPGTPSEDPCPDEGRGHGCILSDGVQAMHQYGISDDDFQQRCETSGGHLVDASPRFYPTTDREAVQNAMRGEAANAEVDEVRHPSASERPLVEWLLAQGRAIPGRVISEELDVVRPSLRAGARNFGDMKAAELRARFTSEPRDTTEPVLLLAMVAFSADEILYRAPAVLARDAELTSSPLPRRAPAPFRAWVDHLRAQILGHACELPLPKDTDAARLGAEWDVPSVGWLESGQRLDRECAHTARRLRDSRVEARFAITLWGDGEPGRYLRAPFDVDEEGEISWQPVDGI